MIEKVGGQQSFRMEVIEGPQLKGNSRGGSGVPCPKKNCSEEARGGACHPPFFLGEKVFLDRKHFLNFESQFLKRSMEKSKRKQITAHTATKLTQSVGPS